jgi:transcriptional regulator of acetoin/glycerol metabolism
MRGRLLRRVLIVDDERENRTKYADLVLNGPSGLKGDTSTQPPIRTEVMIAASAQEGLATLLAARNRGGPFDVLVTDWFMEPLNGLWLVDQLRTNGFTPDSLEVVLLSRRETALEMEEVLRETTAQWQGDSRSGLSVVLRASLGTDGDALNHEEEFLTEVWKGIWAKLDSSIRKDPDDKTPGAVEGALDWRLRFKTQEDGLVQEIDRLLTKFAPTRLPILLDGPTGTGKKLLAQIVHDFSRRTGRYIAGNIATIPAALFESTIFGHEKGAFMGAVETRPGWLEQADDGTLFLEDIDELPLDQQLKLKDALERREVERIGSTNGRKVNVRLISSTTKNLEAEVEAGRFRRDLYVLLKDVRLPIPALAKRRGDIPALIQHFWELDEADFPSRQEHWTSEALEFASTLQWRANAQELLSMIHLLKVQHPQGEAVEPAGLQAMLGLPTGNAPQPQPGQFFISYAKEDVENAKIISDKLERAGRPVFLAERKVNPGALWQNVLRNELKSCSHFLLLATPESLASSWVNLEWSAAWLDGKTIFVVLLRCDTSGLPEPLRAYQAVDFHELDRLISSLEA